MRLMDESTIVNLSKRIAGSIQAGGPGSGRHKGIGGDDDARIRRANINKAFGLPRPGGVSDVSDSAKAARLSEHAAGMSTAARNLESVRTATQNARGHKDAARAHRDAATAYAKVGATGSASDHETSAAYHDQKAKEWMS